MKHQYFGDVNDYRKYGLLRGLQTHSGLRLGACWMLTPDDGRSDGRFVDYLERAGAWRSHDPGLFDSLRSSIGRGRNVSRVLEEGILGDTVFVDEIVPDSKFERGRFFDRSRRSLANTDLVFFDPDNGVEIPSCPAGRRNSSKYLMKNEIAETYGDGRSLIIYQHFIRQERSAFIERISAELGSLTGCREVHCFRTPNVAFLLLPHPNHEAMLTADAINAAAQWTGQIHHSVSALR